MMYYLLKNINCANELNANYAADGYAREKGAAILCTTHTLGDIVNFLKPLVAING